MLRWPPFRLLRPRTLAEAARLLVEEGAGDPGPAGTEGEAGAAGPAAGTVRLVAGGTDLWPNMKRRHQRAETVVSLMGIPELAGIRDGGHGGHGAATAGPEDVRIGATTLLDDVARHPLIAGRY